MQKIHADSPDSIDAALYLTGWNDARRVVESGDDVEILGTCRTLLTEPAQLGIDYDLGALDAFCAAFGTTDYRELSSIVAQ